MKDQPKAVRCAIYCRKSSDEGLDQQFNSLDAQRAGGEAYIQSQVSKGWTCLPTRYDDGGYSGGNMDRPAFQRLLADITRGLIDVIVVYKLDRVTRSIRDFAHINETLEAHGVSLVAVTQSFDSSTAMGRLTLHILLSFASFERELASERTRDKIAMQRQRGQWTGGRPILGYDISPSGLVVNQAEARIVRRIFARYLQLRSIARLVAELRAEGITNKVWKTKAGRAMNGQPFAKSTLAKLLANVLYIGRVPHKSTTYPALHAGIIEPAVFQRVQEIMAENARSGASLTRNTYGGLLKGLLRCTCCDAPMVHTTTRTQAGVTHRYYCCKIRQVSGRSKCAGGLIPAGQIEDFVLEKVRACFADAALVPLVLDLVRAHTQERIRDLEAQRSLLVQGLEDATVQLANGPDAQAAERHESATRSLADVEARIAAEAESLVDRATVEKTLREFTPIWCSLSPTERARLIALVVAEVGFNAKAGEISIRLRERDSAGKAQENAA